MVYSNQSSGSLTFRFSKLLYLSENLKKAYEYRARTLETSNVDTDEDCRKRKIGAPERYIEECDDVNGDGE